MNRSFACFAALFAASLCGSAGAQTFYFNSAGAIPDPQPGNPGCGGPRIMTTTSNAANPIQDVVLTTAMNHTWVGDLRIRLFYTPTGSSTMSSTWVIERPGVSAPGDFGSGNDLDGSFTFALGGTSFNTAAQAFNPLTFGVYSPFDNNFNGSFPVVEFADYFRGLSGTGIWTLTIEDCAVGDAGAVTSASIALQARPLPCLADFNNDGVVNTADLTFFLGRFGGSCP
jgi:subtilisin-like proprotein convertase family protein